MIKNTFMYKLSTLYYDRSNISEGIDINQTSVSKESDICHYCYFLDKRFKLTICLQWL